MLEFLEYVGFTVVGFLHWSSRRAFRGHLHGRRKTHHRTYTPGAFINFPGGGTDGRLPRYQARAHGEVKSVKVHGPLFPTGAREWLIPMMMKI